MKKKISIFSFASITALSPLSSAASEIRSINLWDGTIKGEPFRIKIELIGEKECSLEINTDTKNNSIHIYKGNPIVVTQTYQEAGRYIIRAYGKQLTNEEAKNLLKSNIKNTNDAIEKYKTRKKELDRIDSTLALEREELVKLQNFSAADDPLKWLLIKTSLEKRIRQYNQSVENRDKLRNEINEDLKLDLITNGTSQQKDIAPEGTPEPCSGESEVRITIK